MEHRQQQQQRTTSELVSFHFFLRSSLFSHEFSHNFSFHSHFFFQVRAHSNEMMHIERTQRTPNHHPQRIGRIFFAVGVMIFIFFIAWLIRSYFEGYDEIVKMHHNGWKF